MQSHERERDEERERSGEIAAPEPPAEVRVAQALGNTGMGVLLRQGAGILADGTAHPDVVEAIGRRRGGGQELDRNVSERMSPSLGEPIQGVRVHTDPEANVLASSVQATAFTVGNDIFFGEGAYKPGSSDGDRLIAHEVSHTIQQQGAPTGGPLRVSMPGEALEQEADAVADHLV